MTNLDVSEDRSGPRESDVVSSDKAKKPASGERSAQSKSPRAATVLSLLILSFVLSLVIGQAVALTGEQTVRFAMCALSVPILGVSASIGLIGTLCIILIATDFLVRQDLNFVWKATWVLILAGLTLSALVSFMNMMDFDAHSIAARPPAYLDNYDCIKSDADLGEWSKGAKEFYNRAYAFNLGVVVWSVLILAILVGSRLAKNLLRGYVTSLREMLPW